MSNPECKPRPKADIDTYDHTSRCVDCGMTISRWHGGKPLCQPCLDDEKVDW